MDRTGQRQRSFGRDTERGEGGGRAIRVGEGEWS